MKRLIIAMVALLGFSALAQGQDARAKSWKTLVNDNGFKFKYPDCWTVKPDNPDEMEMKVTSAHFVSVQETQACARPLLYPPHQNLVGIYGGIVKTTPEKTAKDIAILEKNSKNRIQRKELLYFRHTKVGPDDAVISVGQHKDVNFTSIAWGMTLYCPTTQVSFSGPGIKNPDPSYFERLKAGEMAMPEPEKTIFESVRCVDPKSK